MNAASAALAPARTLRGIPGFDPGEEAVPREAWQRFAAHLGVPAEALEADMARRHAAIREQIHRDGVTHNVFGVEGAASRPWPLELLPLLIEPSEWAQLERGICQRAALLQAVLDDVYGPQGLLREGLLPAALVMRHPGYLRALQGVRPAGGAHLRVAAFDVARGPDGQWWMLSQRSQAPSGLGYVLHNRLLVSRQFPQAYRELRVQHIASTYRRLLDGLQAAAREMADGQAPHTVLLTPGPYSETWFEHVYLARYLGLPLVEGSDLTVRGGRLFLKTIEGLEPVHAVLRRVDDDWCDPLELRGDSTLGVPGLLQVVRAGRVVMANAPGSAFLESPAVQGFLPAIAQRLLGESLLLPSVPTWWCGEQAAWDDVHGQLDGRLLRTTFPEGGRTSRVFDTASADVAADPEAWTVQDRLALSRAPLWRDGLVQSRPAMVRLYAVLAADGRWHALPGGMTRVAGAEMGSVSMQRGGSSLDTWVLTDGEVDTFSMLPAPLSAQDISARRRPVSSRTAENLFWLGRYTERAEQVVRLARTVLRSVGEAASLPAPLQGALSALSVRIGLAPWGVPTIAQSPVMFERAVLAAMGDGDGACSLMFDLQAMQRLATSLRDRLSIEQWAMIHSLPQEWAPVAAAGPGAAALPPALVALERLGVTLAAITGAQSDRMTRDAGWRLLTVGRLLERLTGMAAVLEEFLRAAALSGAGEAHDALLELFDSAITFRARHQRHDDLLALADVLVLDDTNPRSLAGVLRRLRLETAKLPAFEAQAALSAAGLPAEGVGLPPSAWGGADPTARALALVTLSQRLTAGGMALADALGHHFFSLSGPAQGVSA